MKFKNIKKIENSQRQLRITSSTIIEIIIETLTLISRKISQMNSQYFTIRFKQLHY
ncbi:unnamed protein product [Paramecium sonneborni]|uniref:Uncharacterized protein n=1 Tax=Paramecium sonneborni TaxID=65129 RepID=A0A8S1RRQ2_9CILI|nr:unnamed protein product [Paramecium sonneborni]